MTQGKNKKLGRKQKKGAKKLADAFKVKEWYDVKAPAVFPTRQIGKTVVSKTQGTRIAKDGLLGRVYNVSLGELKPNTEDDAFRKFLLKVEDVQGKHCLTNFHGMELTTDKLRSLVRKWHSLVEVSAEVKTTDGYLLRLFCIGLTKKVQSQKRNTSYAQHTQIKAIRKKMTQVIQRESSSTDLNTLVSKLITESIGREIERTTQGIYPLQNVLIRKVKVLRAPKVDVSKLLELHGGASAVAAAAASIAVPAAETGVSVDRPEEAPKKDAPKKDAPKKDAAAKKDAGKKDSKKDAAKKDSGKN
jgi:small subunit ribosomal protein S3Ae